MRNENQKKNRLNLIVLISVLYCLLDSFAFAEPIDLSTWEIIQFDTTQNSNAVWTLSEGDTVATQSVNSDPSIFLGDFDVSNCRIRGTFAVGNTDNDMIGFVFGYQGRGHFYLFEWKQTTQQDPRLGIVSEKGMRLGMLSMLGEGDPDASDFGMTSGTENMETLEHNSIVWKNLTEYEFLLDFAPGQFEITMSEVNGDKLAHWTIVDDTYKAGKFGFFNNSQPGAIYKLLDIDCKSGVVYVDDDAPNDPVPYDLTISDPEENGTREHPYDMIQEGIDAAWDGDTVIVRNGTYWENIDFTGKNIKVTSFDPNLPNDQRQPYPVIDGNNQGPVLTFSQGEDLNTELSGFKIMRGLYDEGSAIYCVGSHPIISNCLIVGNRTIDPNFGTTVYCVDSNSIIENCTIADNYGGEYGASIYLVDSNIIINNSIVRNNTSEQIIVESGNEPIVAYSNIQGTWPGIENFDKDPYFACTGYWADSDLLSSEPINPDIIWIDGDYHLMSKKGRWNPIDLGWVKDEDMSPCIDAGDPVSPWSNESIPNGEQINLGAYGGTPQASMSWIPCSLTISATEGGSVTEPGEGTFYYECGASVTIKAKPDAYHYFVGWSSENGHVIDPNDANETSMNLVLDSDVTLSANFKRNNLVVGSSLGGSVELPNGESTPFNRNTPVYIVAIPELCYHFTHWTGTAAKAGKVADINVANTTVLVDADYTLIANFELNEPSDLFLSSSAGGFVTMPGEGTFTYDCNSPVIVIATSEPCYHFVSWTGTAVEAGKVENPNDPNTTVTVDANYTLMANFALNEYVLTISSGTGGSVKTPGEGTFSYDCNTPVPIEATVDEDYYFVKWSGTAVDAGKVANPNKASTTVTMDGNYSLKAHFARSLSPEPRYTLMLSSTSGGSVTSPGEGEFVYAGILLANITATADEGYYFVQWTGNPINNDKVGNPYDASTTVTVDGEYYLTAHFALESKP